MRSRRGLNTIWTAIPTAMPASTALQRTALIGRGRTVRAASFMLRTSDSKTLNFARWSRGRAPASGGIRETDTCGDRSGRQIAKPAASIKQQKSDKVYAALIQAGSHLGRVERNAVTQLVAAPFKDSQLLRAAAFLGARGIASFARPGLKDASNSSPGAGRGCTCPQPRRSPPSNPPQQGAGCRKTASRHG